MLLRVLTLTALGLWSSSTWANPSFRHRVEINIKGLGEEENHLSRSQQRQPSILSSGSEGNGEYSIQEDDGPSCPLPSMPDLSGGNKGLSYAIYYNLREDGRPNRITDGSYSTFDTTLFDKATVEYKDTTEYLGITDAGQLYDYSPRTDLTVISHKGYFYAKIPGEYTFTTTSANDIVLLWLGPSAKSNWTRSTASSTLVYPDTQEKTFKATFEMGEYVPIRVMWANQGGSGYFGLTVTGPYGSVMVSDKPGRKSPYLVKYECPKAEPFNPWGQELPGGEALKTKPLATEQNEDL